MSRMLVAAISVAMLLATIAADRPAAQTPTPPPYSPGIAEIMVMTQVRHAKLWLAGDARNWDLADYQIEEIKEGFEDVVEHFPIYKDIPVGQMIEATIMTPIKNVEEAVKAHDHAKFVSTFDKLTDACNTCHQAANRGFIVIQRPSASAFPGQSFEPRRN